MEKEQIDLDCAQAIQQHLCILLYPLVKHSRVLRFVYFFCFWVWIFQQTVVYFWPQLCSNKPLHPPVICLQDLQMSGVSSTDRSEHSHRPWAAQYFKASQVGALGGPGF